MAGRPRHTLPLVASPPDKPSFAESKAAHAARWGHRLRAQVPPSAEVTAHAAALAAREGTPWPPTWKRYR